MERPVALAWRAGGAPYGFQGAVFPGFIFITETTSGWARFLPLWH
jgi:hypothetical protein